MYKKRKKTLDDPKGFIAGLIYNEGMHLKQNKAFINSESDTVKFFKNNKNKKAETYIVLF